MVDITAKVNSHRSAVAGAVLTVSSADTIRAIEERSVPKGDVLECSRTAGLLAIKRTWEVIPDCHPLPVDFASIRHRIDGLNVHISVEVRTIYKTGVEVEAMHGAAVTALTMYDMLKPLDGHIVISEIRLLEKHGGKSDWLGRPAPEIRAAVVVCSDSVSMGTKADSAGKAVRFLLESEGLTQIHYEVVPDEADAIRDQARRLKDEGYRLAVFVGGTGLSPRDVTPDVLSPLIDRPIPGIMEAARAYGQQRTPYAMFSRGVSGFMGQMLILTLPGSTRGAEESMHAVFPHILHLFEVFRGGRHE